MRNSQKNSSHQRRSRVAEKVTNRQLKHNPERTRRNLKAQVEDGAEGRTSNKPLQPTRTHSSPVLAKAKSRDRRTRGLEASDMGNLKAVPPLKRPVPTNRERLRHLTSNNSRLSRVRKANMAAMHDMAV